MKSIEDRISRLEGLAVLLFFAIISWWILGFLHVTLTHSKKPSEIEVKNDKTN